MPPYEPCGSGRTLVYFLQTLVQTAMVMSAVNSSSPDLPRLSLSASPVSSCRIPCRETDVTDIGKPPSESSFCQPRRHIPTLLPACIPPSHGIPSSRQRCSALASDCVCRRLLCIPIKLSLTKDTVHPTQPSIPPGIAGWG